MVISQKISVLNLTAVMCAVLIFGFSLKARNQSFVCLLSDENICNVEGVVCSNPSITSNGRFYSCDLSVSKVKANNRNDSDYSAKGKIKLLLPSEIVESHYPKKMYSKAQSNDVFIENGAKISADVSCLDGSTHLFIVKKARFSGWNSYFSWLRGCSRINFKRLLSMWGFSGGFLLALLAASKEATNPILTESFRNAGLSHILALSGMHVSIFAGTTEKLFVRVAGKRATQYLSILSVLIFVWFAGMSPSLTRALISTIISFILVKLTIKCGILDVLSLSFIFQIVLFPRDSASVSFMLSYLSLFGIITLGEFIKKYLNCFTGNYLAGQFSASISAICFTGPLSASIFGSIFPVGILSSIVISPIVTVFLISGLFCIVLSLIFPFLIKPLGSILEILYYVIEKSSVFFAGFPPIKIN